MKLRPAMLCWAAIILLAVPRIAAAQSDVFMCVDGIKGSSTDSEFADCSEIFGVSYSVGVEGDPPPPGGGGRRVATTCGLYVVSKALDASSVPLLISSLLGQSIAEVEFAVRDRGEEPTVFFELVLKSVLIVEVEQELGAAAEVPVEKVVIQPEKVDWRFIPQDESGAPGEAVEGGFDCVRNAAR